jgi:hypothetical protein
MIGYIYKTKNNINGKVYIGKHKKSYFDKNYYGSGIAIKQAIKKYKKENFTVVIVARAKTEEELNNLEKSIIAIFKRHYGRRCYNIAIGGEGGDMTKYMSSQRKDLFISKMSTINKERCSSTWFRNLQSDRLKKLYENEEERVKVSKRTKELWKTEEYRKKVENGRNRYMESDKYKLNMKKTSERMKEYWADEGNKRKMSETQKKIWTAEKRQQQSELLKNKFKNNESLREKHSADSKKRWQNPEYREMMSNNAKKNNLSKYGTEARKVKLKFTDRDNIEHIFESRKAFEDYCREKYGKIIDARHYNSMLSGERYYSRYKRLQNIFGNCLLEKMN